MMPLIRFYEEHDQKRTVRRMLNIFYRSGLLVPVLAILGLFSSGKKVGSGSGQRDPDPKSTNSSPAAA